MEVLRSEAANVFALADGNVLCIQRGYGTSKDDESLDADSVVVSLSNFSGKHINLDLEAIFEHQKLLLMQLSTTQDHVIMGEYMTRHFTLFPHEGVVFTFI